MGVREITIILNSDQSVKAYNINKLTVKTLRCCYFYKTISFVLFIA